MRNRILDLIFLFNDVPDGIYDIIPTEDVPIFCDMSFDKGDCTLAQTLSVDEDSPNWFKNHPNFLNSVTGKKATQVMWKGFDDTNYSSENGNTSL